MPQRDLIPITEAEVSVLRRTARLLQVFREIDGSMPASYALCFCLVGQYPGIKVSDIATMLEMPRPTISRILLELGRRSRGGGEGYGLISAERESADLREVHHKLTAHGRKVMASLVKEMTA